jgi:hypothetical protein
VLSQSVCSTLPTIVHQLEDLFFGRGVGWILGSDHDQSLSWLDMPTWKWQSLLPPATALPSLGTRGQMSHSILTGKIREYAACNASHFTIPAGGPLHWDQGPLLHCALPAMCSASPWIRLHRTCANVTSPSAPSRGLHGSLRYTTRRWSSRVGGIRLASYL